MWSVSNDIQSLFVSAFFFYVIRLIFYKHLLSVRHDIWWYFFFFFFFFFFFWWPNILFFLWYHFFFFFFFFFHWWYCLCCFFHSFSIRWCFFYSFSTVKRWQWWYSHRYALFTLYILMIFSDDTTILCSSLYVAVIVYFLVFLHSSWLVRYSMMLIDRTDVNDNWCDVIFSQFFLICAVSIGDDYDIIYASCCSLCSLFSFWSSDGGGMVRWYVLLGDIHSFFELVLTKWWAVCSRHACWWWIISRAWSNSLYFFFFCLFDLFFFFFDVWWW